MPTVAESLDVQVPKVALEPARRVGNIIASVVVLIGALIAVVQPFVDLLPGEYHGQVSAAVAVAAGLTALAARLSAELIRGQVTPYEVYKQKVEEILAGKTANP